MKLLMPLLSLFFPKLKIRERNWRRVLAQCTFQKSEHKKLIWFHAASMGEFEQAKPIIEKLKKETDVKIVVSFFSPSGYENSKKYPYADIITYLPFDSRWRAKRFIEIISPNMAVFMRYDIWPNHIWP